MSGSTNLQLIIGELAKGKAEINRLRVLTESLDNEISVEDLFTFWNMSPDMFVIASTDGHFIKVNSSWTDVLGWAEDELLSKSWFDFVHPSDVRSTREVVGHMTTGKIIRFVNRYKKLDGDYVCLEWSATQWIAGKCYAVARPVPPHCTNCPEIISRFGFEVESNGGKSE